MIGLEALPRLDDDMPGKSFNIPPIEYCLFFSNSWDSNKIFPLSPSKLVAGFIFEVIKTSGAENNVSVFSAFK